ncbi:MAG TPA: hypothetical protein PLG31_03220 [Spirochaetota bacterium]|nr:hypothetical protein [Spirochaetota bacterium]
MSSLKSRLTAILNLDTRNQPYSAAQIAGMMAIVVLLFPLLFTLFGFLSAPLAGLIEVVFRPRDPDAVRAAKIAVLIVKTALGLTGGLWICRIVWPKRLALPRDQGNEHPVFPK